MTDRISVPVNPSLEMCCAFLRGQGYYDAEIEIWRAHLKRTIGTGREPAFVAGLRAALVEVGLPAHRLGAAA